MTMSEDMVITVARSVFDINKAAHDKGLMTTWTIYNKPKDFPNGFIARCFHIGGGEPEPMATNFAISGDLILIRECMERCGLVRMMRNPGDHPSVVETWM